MDDFTFIFQTPFCGIICKVFIAPVSFSKKIYNGCVFAAINYYTKIRGGNPNFVFSI